MGDDLERFRREWKQQLQEKTGEEVKPNAGQQGGSGPAQGSTSQPSASQSSEVTASKLGESVSSDLQAEEAAKAEGAASEWGGVGTVIKPRRPDTSEADQLFSFNIAHSLLSGKAIDLGRKRRRPGEGGDGRKGKLAREAGGASEDGEPPPKDDDADTALVDLLIRDIDELSDVPFFDLELPREVALKIFKHLDMAALSRCAQVSRSWQSISEDELLWSRIAHGLKLQPATAVHELAGWKLLVRRHVSRRLRLERNWKSRNCESRRVEFYSGGVLTAAACDGNTIVAGYAKGQVRVWEEGGGEVTLEPSSRAYRVVENEEDAPGLTRNYPLLLATRGGVTAAATTHGIVDIWERGDRGTRPKHSIQLSSVDVRAETRGLALWRGPGGQSLVAAASGSSVTVEGTDPAHPSQFSALHSFRAGSQVNHLTFLPWTATQPPLVLVDKSRVFLIPVGTPYDAVNPLHDVYSSVTSTTDVTGDTLAVAMSTYAEIFGGYKVLLYDVATGQLKQTLSGCASRVSCVNIRHAPPHSLITGSVDKRVRVFDTRCHKPTLTLRGHAADVRRVQMDAWHAVSGDGGGMVCVWDLRLGGTRLWDTTNRHPVRMLHFNEAKLVSANIPSTLTAEILDDPEGVPIRFRGSLHVQNFDVQEQRGELDDFFLSSYDEPERAHGNVSLAVPYS